MVDKEEEEEEEEDEDEESALTVMEVLRGEGAVDNPAGEFGSEQRS